MSRRWKRWCAGIAWVVDRRAQRRRALRGCGRATILLGLLDSFPGILVAWRPGMLILGIRLSELRGCFAVKLRWLCRSQGEQRISQRLRGAKTCGSRGSGGKTRVEIRPRAHTHKARTSPQTRDWSTVNRTKAGDKGGLPDARKSLGHNETTNKNVTMEPHADICALPFLSTQPNGCGLGEGAPRPAWFAAVGVFLELGGSLGDGPWAKLCQTGSWVVVCIRSAGA